MASGMEENPGVGLSESSSTLLSSSGNPMDVGTSSRTIEALAITSAFNLGEDDLGEFTMVELEAKFGEKISLFRVRDPVDMLLYLHPLLEID